MWAEESVIYQIYPLGMCGAPYENDGILAHRILEVKEWIPHMKKLGVTAVYFCPVFESDTHGYNTRDYKKIDCRLGSMQAGSASSWTVYSTTSAAVSAPSGMSLRRSGSRLTGIGSISVSTEIRLTMTASGTRDGKAITTLSSSISATRR